MGVLVLKLDGTLSNGQEIRWPLGFSVNVTAVRVTPAVQTAPTGAVAVVRVQNQSGASPSQFIEAQIGVGALVGVTAGGAVLAASGSSDLYLRVVTASGAAGLIVTVEYVAALGDPNVLLADRDGPVPGASNLLFLPGPSTSSVIRNARIRLLTPQGAGPGTLSFAIQPLFADLSVQPNGGIVVFVGTNGETQGAPAFGTFPMPLPGGSIIRLSVINATTGPAADLLLAIELDEAATGDALCSTDEVKQFLGIDTPDVDAEIALAVSAASDMLRSYTARQLSAQRPIDAERHDRLGGAAVDRVVLREWPVLQVDEVRDSEGAVIAPTLYAIDKPTGTLRGIGLTFGDVEIDYVTGFAAGLPGDLRYAAIMQAAYLYRQADSGGARLGNRGPAQAAAGSPGYLTEGWVPQAQAIADRYRRAG